MNKTKTKMVTFMVPDNERRLIDNYAAKSSRSRTDVLRELIRSLPDVTKQGNMEAISATR